MPFLSFLTIYIIRFIGIIRINEAKQRNLKQIQPLQQPNLKHRNKKYRKYLKHQIQKEELSKATKSRTDIKLLFRDDDLYNRNH